MTGSVRVAIVGLEFGAEFIPIYQAHPDAANESGKKYMMMETVVYSREFLFVKSIYDSGEMTGPVLPIIPSAGYDRVAEDCEPYPNASQAANITCDDERVALPEFTLWK